MSTDPAVVAAGQAMAQEFQQALANAVAVVASVSYQAPWTPAVRSNPTPDELQLTADVPGWAGSAISVKFDSLSGALTISGDALFQKAEKGVASDPGGGSAQQQNQKLPPASAAHGGPWSASFQVERQWDGSEATATVANGVLTVTIPRARAVQIPVGG
jgi:HSP20 family molecular chaperone IbpA